MSKFSDLIGQDTIIKRLENQISAGKVSHAYIISGAKGSGKMMLAESFARELVSSGENAQHSRIQADAHAHPDIIYVSHEKPKVIAVGEIRSQISETVFIKPYSSPYKIYIVDEAWKMNVQAQNALLKTLEEPPAYAVIMLLAENVEKFLPTILSRCLKIEMLPVPETEIAGWLVKEHGIKERDAAACASFSGGAPGKALALSKDEEFVCMRDAVAGFLAELPSMPAYRIPGKAKELEEYKGRADDLLDFVLFWYLDVLSYKTTGSRTRFSGHENDIEKQAAKIPHVSLIKITELVAGERERLAANVGYANSMDCMWIGIRENIKWQ